MATPPDIYIEAPEVDPAKQRKEKIINLMYFTVLPLVVVAAIAVGVMVYYTVQTGNKQAQENKRFLKCLILLPQDPSLYTTKEQRVVAIDNCAKNNPTAQ